MNFSAKRNLCSFKSNFVKKKILIKIYRKVHLNSRKITIFEGIWFFFSKKRETYLQNKNQKIML